MHDFDPTGIHSYEEQQAQHAREARALGPAGHALAETLWGIERYKVPSAPEPAPIYVALALHLQNDHKLRKALEEALHNLDAAQKAVGDRNVGE